MKFERDLGVEPKIMGFPLKWMVKIRETPIKMDDLGGKPTIFETPIPRCFDRGTLLGLLPTTAAHVYAGTLAPSSSELMPLGHH